ncbi:MAG: lysoplasmalogenase [Treponema sp.]|jgi:uncharacterized membrane protein YhhN|nr:lysoplasmalogenase [Treponema sp.]
MITFGIYCLAAVINLASAFLFKESLRKISKGCLMPALLVFYIFNADQIIYMIIAALVFSCAGDILLIYKEKQIFFKLGLAAFLVSHICYIAAFAVMTQNFNIPALIISAAAAIPIVLIILKWLNASPQMKIPVAVYAAVIMLMSLSALQLMLSRMELAGILIFAGSVVYLFSDSYMSYLLFNGKPKYFNFTTMIPYIIAQGSIVMGLAQGFNG